MILKKEKGSNPKAKKQVNGKWMIKSKEKFKTKFINTLKKRWLISGTNTILLIAILIAITIFINKIVASFKFTPIDLTSNKQYTLTEESKERTANIQDNVNIYFVGYAEEDNAITLARQYNKNNKNINVEIIDINKRTDIASKYNLSSENTSIVVENGEKSYVLGEADLVTYDDNYNTVDLTEEKITSAILRVTTEKVPNIYFLAGYSDYSIDNSGGLKYFSQYLDDEVLEYKSLDILVTGQIPDDCDLLIITTPSKDFDEFTTNKITEYINNEGKILWLNSSYANAVNLTNVNKILSLYGINPFEVGYIYEVDSKRTALGYQSCIVEDLGNTKIDSDLKNAVLLNSTKINYDETKMNEQNVTKQDIIMSSEKAYFRKDISDTSSDVKNDEKGPFTIGAIFDKKLNDSENSEEIKTSSLVLIGDNNFLSDIQIANGVYPMIFLYDNKDLALNSIAYLTNQDSGITIRKNYTNTSSFTATQSQKNTIMRIVFIVPVAIIIFGIIVWQIRRRRK